MALECCMSQDLSYWHIPEKAGDVVKVVSECSTSDEPGPMQAWVVSSRKKGTKGQNNMYCSLQHQVGSAGKDGCPFGVRT